MLYQEVLSKRKEQLNTGRVLYIANIASRVARALTPTDNNLIPYDKFEQTVSFWLLPRNAYTDGIIDLGIALAQVNGKLGIVQTDNGKFVFPL